MTKWSEVGRGVGMGVCGLVVLGHFFGVSTALVITGLCLAAAILKPDELVWLGGGVVVGWCCMAEGTGPAAVGHFLLLIICPAMQFWVWTIVRALFGTQLPPWAISEQDGWVLLAHMIWRLGPMLIAFNTEPSRLCCFAQRLQSLPPILRSLAYFMTDIHHMLLFMMARIDIQHIAMASPYCLSVFASVCRDVPDYSISKSFLPPLPNLESVSPLNPVPLFNSFILSRIIETTKSCHLLIRNIAQLNNEQGATELRRFLFDTNMGRLLYADFRINLPWAPYNPIVAMRCEGSLRLLQQLVHGRANWAQEGAMMGPGGEGGVGGLWNRRAAADALRDRLPSDFATTLRRVSLSPACPPSLQAQAGTLLAYLQNLTLFPINAGDAF